MAALRLNYGRSNPVTAAAAASTTRLVYNFIQSLTLIPTQTITHTTHTPRTATTATNTTTAGATSSSSISFIPSLLNSLRDLLPPWLLAVPKSKTTHSKKAMRNSNKGLKEQQGEIAAFPLPLLSPYFFSLRFHPMYFPVGRDWN